MIFLIIILLILITMISFGLYIFKEAFYRNPKDDDIHNIPDGEAYQKSKEYFIELIDKFNNLPYENVYIKTYDGKKLHGRYYHCSDDAPIDICFHGYRGTLVRDFCGGAKICFECKHNVLVVDQRAHGFSEGKTISFGIRERYDCVEWVKYIVNRFPNNKILLYGVSMGGATILMASNLNLPKNVVGIVADSPFSSPEKIIRKVLDDRGFPNRIFYPFIYISALIFGGLNLKHGSAIESVKNTNIPILLIHGKKDTFVPCSMSKDIKKAAKTCYDLALFENAEHGISYIADEKTYTKIVKDFIKSVLK
ncbi:MAG: alpha/beta hydrolase [Bacilli bacterium]|nr:alpha/beta hydrolase [Bacilli bacterium]